MASPLIDTICDYSTADSSWITRLTWIDTTTVTTRQNESQLPIGDRLSRFCWVVLLNKGHSLCVEP